jgi:hypothetical protein
MVYIPRVNFKTGIFPSLVRSFAADGNYTGTQKLMLTSSRIFGNKIGYISLFMQRHHAFRNSSLQGVAYESAVSELLASGPPNDAQVLAVDGGGRRGCLQES